MKILVTGGAGYIGSHTCKALHAAGHTPIALDNLVYGHDWACKWGPLEQGDLADPAFISSMSSTPSRRLVEMPRMSAR